MKLNSVASISSPFAFNMSSYETDLEQLKISKPNNNIPNGIKRLNFCKPETIAFELREVLMSVICAI